MTTPTHDRPTGVLLLLSVALVIGIIALVLAIQNAAAFGAEQNRREQERLATDFAACQRGNALRQQIKDVGLAEEKLVDGVLDTVLPEEGSPERIARIQELRAEMDPLFVEYRRTVDAIQLTDCDRAVPGGRAAQANRKP